MNSVSLKGADRNCERMRVQPLPPYQQSREHNLHGDQIELPLCDSTCPSRPATPMASISCGETMQLDQSCLGHIAVLALTPERTQPDRLAWEESAQRPSRLCVRVHV